MLFKRGQHISKLVRSALSVLTGRQVVFLPPISRSEDLMLQVRAAYRIESGRLAMDVTDAGCGELEAFVFGFEGHFPTRELWRSTPQPYRGPVRLDFDLASGAVEYGGIPWGRIPIPIRGRRFNIRLSLHSASGVKSRETGHYFPGESGPANEWYFHGDNYVDHELQSRFEADQVLRLLERQVVKGPILEVGCATGAMLHALRGAGFDCVGVDVSAWAVEQANRLMGEEVAWLWNAEDETPPPSIVARRPYGALILWAVMEHFKDPFASLAKLTALTQPGSLLLINTSNCDSMLHWLFGREWEGYFDATHYGVDQVGVRRLRQLLPALGWQIEMLQTFLVWDSNSDPIHASLREWYSYDARLRCLLKERDLGDMIHCVARRQ